MLTDPHHEWESDIFPFLALNVSSAQNSFPVLEYQLKLLVTRGTLLT
nr:MAG TPA: hypothetical protein [Caudoviricetes sp.]